MPAKPGTSTAETALQIYDREGEAAFLSFTRIHALRDCSEDDRQDVGEDTDYRFHDGTTVTMPDPENYQFTWRDPARKEIIRHKRPQLLDITAAPEFPPPAKPLTDWPNSNSIHYQVMKLLEERVNPKENDDNQTDPVLTDHRSHLLAPSLRQEIDRIMTVYQLSDSLLDLLDEANEEIAEMVLERLNDTEIQQLMQAIESEA